MQNMRIFNGLHFTQIFYLLFTIFRPYYYFLLCLLYSIFPPNPPIPLPIPSDPPDWRSQQQLQLSWKLQASRHEFLNFQWQDAFYFQFIKWQTADSHLFQLTGILATPPCRPRSLTNLRRGQKYYSTNMVFMLKSAIMGPGYRVPTDSQTFHLPKVCATNFVSFSLFSWMISTVLGYIRKVISVWHL